jgi:hypothetical protein
VEPVFGGHLVEDKREPVSKVDHILLENRFVMANDQLANLLFDCDDSILNAPDVSCDQELTPSRLFQTVRFAPQIRLDLLQFLSSFLVEFPMFPHGRKFLVPEGRRLVLPVHLGNAGLNRGRVALHLLIQKVEHGIQNVQQSFDAFVEDSTQWIQNIITVGDQLLTQ